MTLILGIDDAGRGPVIGSMVMAGVLLTKEQESRLAKENITDSKLLYQSTRVKLAKLIKENSKAHKIITISAEEIDSALLSPDTNLNKLEAQKAAEVITALNRGKERITVIVDCPSSNIQAWKNTLLTFLTKTSNLTVKCEHKADFKYKSVSAASILAKVTREEEVSKLKNQYAKYGDMGSGYPSDPTTKEFLKKNGKTLADAGIFRKTWSTYKKLFPEKTLF